MNSFVRCLFSWAPYFFPYNECNCPFLGKGTLNNLIDGESIHFTPCGCSRASYIEASSPASAVTFSLACKTARKIFVRAGFNYKKRAIFVDISNYDSVNYLEWFHEALKFPSIAATGSSVDVISEFLERAAFGKKWSFFKCIVIFYLFSCFCLVPYFISIFADSYL